MVKKNNLVKYKDSGTVNLDGIKWGYVKTARNINCYVIKCNNQLFVVIRNLNDNGGHGGVGGGLGGVMNKFHLQDIDDFSEKRHTSTQVEQQYIKKKEYTMPLVHHGYLHMLFGKKKTDSEYHTYASNKIFDMMKTIGGDSVTKIIFSGQSAGAALLYMITYQLFNHSQWAEKFGQKDTRVVTWNSPKPGNTKFSNNWGKKATEAGVTIHTPYLTNHALEPCVPLKARSSGLSRIYTPVKGNKGTAPEENIFDVNETNVGAVLEKNGQLFMSIWTMGDAAHWTGKKNDLRKFGIKTVPRYQDNIPKVAREDIGDTTKSGMESSQFMGSSQLGNIIVYKTWQIFFSMHCSRKMGMSGFCTEINHESMTTQGGYSGRKKKTKKRKIRKSVAKKKKKKKKTKKTRKNRKKKKKKTRKKRK